VSPAYQFPKRQAGLEDRNAVIKEFYTEGSHMKQDSKTPGDVESRFIDGNLLVAETRQQKKEQQLKTSWWYYPPQPPWLQDLL
jgi:hypothetical protein